MKKLEENRKNSDTLTQKADKGWWLKGLGFAWLVDEFVGLSRMHSLPWTDRWDDNLGDPAWCGQAMANTYVRLSDEDKDKLSAEYERFLMFDGFLDLTTVRRAPFMAVCYLLDRFGRRVRWHGECKTGLVSLEGETEEEALSKLNTGTYEFKTWWR